MISKKMHTIFKIRKMHDSYRNLVGNAVWLQMSQITVQNDSLYIIIKSDLIVVISII